MARRRGYTVNLPCTYPGCRAFSHHEASTRDEEFRIRQGTGKRWKCDEHFGLECRLLPGRVEIVTRLENKRSSSYPTLANLFWGGSNGYAHGPGFEARSKDWPEGTVLEVTARIIVPKTETLEPGAGEQEKKT